MEKIKRICFITQSFSRQDSLIVHRQGKSLVESGYRVSYILCDGKPDEVRYGIEMKSIDISFSGLLYKAISKVPQLKSRYERWIKTHRLKEYLRNYDADIFQINDFEHLSLGCFLKRQGKKVVYDLREYFPVYYARRRKWSILRRINQFLLEREFTRASRYFDAVFSCMPEMHDYIKERVLSTYFEDVANFPVVNKDFTLSYDEYASREKIISYFGSIYKISCQEVILEALERLPDVKYTLAGVFYDKKYQEQVMSRPAWKQVKFINGFAREELPAIINSSIIGNVVKDFNQTETPQGSFSIIKIFETMEAAIPVILAKVPLYEQMVEKYHCGICVDPHSADDFEKAISYLLNNPKEAYEMGQNGRRAVLEEFSWESQYVRYLEVLEKVLQ